MNTRDSYKRRVARLEKHLEIAREAHMRLIQDQAKTRLHYQDIVAKHIANERRGDALLLEDRFKIQELENQVAVQWKNLSEAKDDAGTAQLNYQVIQKSLTQARSERDQARRALSSLEDAHNCLADQLRAAQQTFSYRSWVAITSGIARSKLAASRKWLAIKDRAVNRFLIRRLSSDRVKALTEAGHVVPEKIIRSALAYYEHDKRRMEIDEQIKELHQGVENGKFYAHAVIEKRPSMWRRLMILIGRA